MTIHEKFIDWYSTNLEKTTEADLSREIGARISNISNWLYGSSLPSMANLQRLVDAFGSPFVFGEGHEIEGSTTAEAIENLKAYKGLNQKELAKLSCVSEACLMDIKRGRSTPRVGVLEALFGASECSYTVRPGGERE